MPELQLTSPRKERPECRRCVNYGAECVYPVKKAFDAVAVDAALGSRHNRPSNVAATAIAVHGGDGGSDAHLDNSAHSPPAHSLASSLPPLPPLPPLRPRGDERRLIDSVPPLELVHALFRKTKMGSFFSNPTDPPEFLSLAFPEPDDLRCVRRRDAAQKPKMTSTLTPRKQFHHALTYSLSIMVIDEDRNPWVEHIAPMFLFPTGDAPLSTQALKYAMLAIGATHLAYLEATSRVPNAEHTLQLSKNYRHTTIGLLRQARRMPSEREHDAFLAASLMLVDHDILAASVSWREPLRYAKTALAYRGGAGSVLFGPDWRTALSGRGMDITPPPSVRRYLVEHGVMHDILSCFTTGDPPTILNNDSPWWEALGTTGITDREVSTTARRGYMLTAAQWESIESLVGFDRSILRIFSSVLALYAEWRRFEDRYRPVNELDPSVSPHSSAAMDRLELSRRLTDMQMELATWRAEASTRYMAARTMVGSMTLWHAAQILILRDMQKRSREDAEIQSSAAAILELCIEVGDKVEFLNWSLVVACCVILDPEKRNVARGIIKTFAYQCCHEIESTRMLIEEMWRRMDEGYDDEACNWREIAIEIGRSVLIG